MTAPTLDRILEEYLYSRGDMFEGSKFLNGLEDRYWEDLVIGKILSGNEEVSSAHLSRELAKGIQESVNRFLWVLVDNILNSPKPVSSLSKEELIRLTPIKELRLMTGAIRREIFDHVLGNPSASYFC